MNRLVAVVLTYNEARHIQACLDTLAFADVRIVFDSWSDDATVALASQSGARVMQHAFTDFASQRNAALDAIAELGEWVLFVDADERIPPALAAEIRSAIEDPEKSTYQIPRHNYIFGRLTLGAGWYPDYQTRLLRLGHARYDPLRKVHERVISDGPIGVLRTPIVHHNYETLEQFHQTQRRYTALEARVLLEAGTKPRPWTALSQPVRQFWWRFVQLKGYSDGWHGLRLSLLMARYEFAKVAMLRELLEKRGG
jgi:(heptosyl)LPS beta-1,4-glucosyltransferase